MAMATGVESRSMETRLRGALTDREYRRVIRQLEGAVQAVDLLTDRAPDVVRLFFQRLERRTDLAVPAQARDALLALMRELQRRPARAVPPRPLQLIRR